jgi:hypothetical protein
MTAAAIQEAGIHPTNGRRLLDRLATCGECAHRDPATGACYASRGPTATAEAQWPACVRFMHRGYLSRIADKLGHRGLIGRALRELTVHPLGLALAGLGALLSYPVSMLIGIHGG